MSSFENKLRNYEVVPPAGAWEKIAAALDEEHKFPARLYNMEITPPAAAWDAIHASLDSPAAVVPMRKRTSAFFRYAAAAVFTGIAALGIIKWTGSNRTEGSGMANAANGGAQNSENRPSTIQKFTGNKDENKAPGKTKPELAGLGQPAGDPVRKNRGPAISTARYTERINNEGALPMYAYEDHLPKMADRYITLMTPQGNFIRMSKKWEDLICCVSGEEQDDDCRTQLKKWQEKIAASPLTNSPGNVLDILHLVNSLDERTGL